MEILFRGYDQEHQKWVYGWYTKLVEGIRIIDAIITPDKDSEFTRYYIHSSETIGQYTGRKDIDGNKIFKGDIILLTNSFGRKITGIVKYNLKHLTYHLTVSESEWYSLGSLGEIPQETIKIIGNISQNPELME